MFLLNAPTLLTVCVFSFTVPASFRSSRRESSLSSRMLRRQSSNTASLAGGAENLTASGAVGKSKDAEEEEKLPVPPRYCMSRRGGGGEEAGSVYCTLKYSRFFGLSVDLPYPSVDHLHSFCLYFIISIYICI